MFCWSNEQEDPVAGMALDERLLASFTIDLQVRPGDQRMHAYEIKMRKLEVCCPYGRGLMPSLAFRKQVMEDMRWAVLGQRPGTSTLVPTLPDRSPHAE